MLRLFRIGVIAFALFVATGLTFACDDAGEDEPEVTATVAAESDQTPTVDEAVAPTEESTSTPEPPLGLESFHYTVALDMTIDQPAPQEDATITGTVEGDFVAPWSHAWEQSFELAGLSGSESFVIIGDDAWKREGIGAWEETTQADLAAADALDLTAADPSFLGDLEFTNELGELEGEPEQINGVSALRYDLSEQIDAFIDLFGTDFFQGEAAGLEDLEMTVWLEEGTQTLVRADLAAVAGPEILAGTDAPFAISTDAKVRVHMTIDITQMNDPSIRVEPPI